MILNFLNNLLSVLCAVACGIFYFINNNIISAVNIFKGIGIIVLALIVSYIAFFILIWLFFICVGLPISKTKEYKKPSKVFNKIFVFWYSYITNFFRLRIKSSGVEKVPFGTRFLIVSNHRSNLDNMVQALVLKKEHISYISKPENFKIILAGRYMNRNMYLPIDRDNVKNALVTIIKAIGFIKQNLLSVGVYPEGKRSKTGELLEFKPGCFKIAEKAKCPIVVTTIQGTEKVHKNFPFKKTVVNFDVLTVLNPQDYEGLSTVEISDKIYSLMKDKLQK